MLKADGINGHQVKGCLFQIKKYGAITFAVQASMRETPKVCSSIGLFWNCAN
jgi:hypothetical protein